LATELPEGQPRNPRGMSILSLHAGTVKSRLTSLLHEGVRARRSAVLRVAHTCRDSRRTKRRNRPQSVRLAQLQRRLQHREQPLDLGAHQYETRVQLGAGVVGVVVVELVDRAVE